MNSLLCLCLQDKNWDRQLFVKSCHLNGWRMVNSARSYNIQHPCVDVACRVSSKMTIRLRRGWCDVLWCYLSSVLYSYLRMWRYSNCAICSFILERQRLDVGAEILFIRDTYFSFVPDILAHSCWNKKFISFQKSNLLKLRRRIVQNRDVNSTNILILWRVVSNLLRCFYGFRISGATR